MPLLAISCPHCQHTGFVSADRLPGVLRCSDCSFARMVRTANRTVSSRRAAALNAADNRPKQPRQRALMSRGKRVLTPRMPAVA
jgi:hypothetical protein